MIRIFMVPLSLGGLGLDRALVQIEHALRQLLVGGGLQVRLELRIQLEDLARQQALDLLPAGAAGSVR